MTNTDSVRKSFLAITAAGIVFFSLNGLDSTLKPSHFAAHQTTAQVIA